MVLHAYIYVNGTRKQNEDSGYNLRIQLRVADFATAQFNYTHVLLFVRGLHKLFWVSQTRQQFCSDFERYSFLGICLLNPKQQRRSRKCSIVADSMTSLILVCCEIR